MFSLVGPVPAGTYHFVLDAIVMAKVDVDFELVWRRGEQDTTLAMWSKHFDPLPNGSYDAQAYEVDQMAPKVDFDGGDQLMSFIEIEMKS